jgi:hypothetical protein
MKSRGSERFPVGTAARCVVLRFPFICLQPNTGGSEFNDVPAATGRSRQDRSRSTRGLVSRSIGSISNLVFRHLA